MANIKIKYRKTKHKLSKLKPVVSESASVSKMPPKATETTAKAIVTPVAILSAKDRLVLAFKAKNHFVFVKNRKFQLIAGIILLVVVSFYTGGKLEKLLNTDNSAGVKQNPVNSLTSTLVPANNNTAGGNTINTTIAVTPAELNTMVFNGIINSVDSKKLVAKNSAGETKTFLFDQQSVVISPEGKAITSSGLKAGETVLIFARNNSDNTLTLIRLKIITVAK